MPTADPLWIAQIHSIQSQTALENLPIAPFAGAIHLTHFEFERHADCIALLPELTAFFRLQSHELLEQLVQQQFVIAQPLDGQPDNLQRTDLARPATHFALISVHAIASQDFPSLARELTYLLAQSQRHTTARPHDLLNGLAGLQKLHQLVIFHDDAKHLQG